MAKHISRLKRLILLTGFIAMLVIIGLLIYNTIESRSGDDPNNEVKSLLSTRQVSAIK